MNIKKKKTTYKKKIVNFDILNYRNKKENKKRKVNRIYKEAFSKGFLSHKNRNALKKHLKDEFPDKKDLEKLDCTLEKHFPNHLKKYEKIKEYSDNKIKDLEIINTKLREKQIEFIFIKNIFILMNKMHWLTSENLENEIAYISDKKRFRRRKIKCERNNLLLDNLILS